MGLWLGSPHCRSVLALRRLACLETAEALGWVQPLPPEPAKWSRPSSPLRSTPSACAVACPVPARLGPEGHLCRDPRLASALRIVGPALRQIQLEVNRTVLRRARYLQADPDLAIRDLARGARVLQTCRAASSRSASSLHWLSPTKCSSLSCMCRVSSGSTAPPPTSLLRLFPEPG